MISRKENLLIKPWQDRRYENHRRKVQSASAVIDNNAPLPRYHVAMKLKQKQKEIERCEEIENNNFLLLKRLNYVMRTSRVDNNWTKPQPNFLNRIPVYEPKKMPKLEQVPSVDDTRTRKIKCLACAQVPLQIQETIPEERVPWEPIRKPRSKSVPVRKPVEKVTLPKSANAKSERKFVAKEPQSITLRRGCLKLSVHFPSDTVVKFSEGHQEKVLVSNVCHCNFGGVMVS